MPKRFMKKWWVSRVLKKIKKYFEKRKMQKQIQHELLETMANMCLYLDYEARRTHNPYGKYMRSHFEGLKHYSEKTREDLVGEDK